jgi:hypothetical protein
MRKLRNQTRKKSHKSNKITKKNISNKTVKSNNKAGIIRQRNIISIPNKTPVDILNVKFSKNNESTWFDSPLSRFKSYAPSVNKRLVTLQSIRRNKLGECNNKNAFLLKEPLQIKTNKKCFPYHAQEAQQFLLNNLRANKHLDVNKIITPVQSQSNCWFNTMFVSFFISDKGRKFYHFFRQLMIQGKQSNGTPIPDSLWGSFSLLNFAIESCLTGNEYAYDLDTNSIIKHIYLSIPNSYKKKADYLVDVNYANNPIYYYKTLMNYLNVNELSSLIVNVFDNNWKHSVEQKMKEEAHIPHVIVLEIFDSSDKTSGYSGKITNKETTFSINGFTYELDSSIIRDIEQNHFSEVLTCEGNEMAYDGASFHRLSPMKWKHLLNRNDKWKFEGSEKEDGTSLYWSFLHGYQMLFYYRTK